MGNESRLSVENANFEKVGYFVEKMLSETEQYCGCLRCRLDATAIALNTLPPHYYVDAGHMNKSDIGSPWILIEMAVREALEQVRRNPHHKLGGRGEEIARPRAFG